MRDQFKQLGKESLIYGVSGMLNKFIAIFLVPVYTNVLTEDEFGLQGLLVAVLTLAAMVAVLGMDSAAHNWYWQTEDEGDRRKTVSSWFWCQLAASLLLAGVIAVFAGPLAALITDQKDAASLLRLASLTLPLNVCHAVVPNYFRLRRKAMATMWYTLVSNLNLVALTVLFIPVLHHGVAGFFQAQIISGIVTTCAGLWILRHSISPRFARFGRLREMLAYALPLVPAALGFWIISLADRLFIENMASTRELAHYQVGAMLASVVAMFTGAFSAAWGPFALSMQHRAEAPQFYARVLPAFLALGGCVVTGVALFTKEAVHLVAKPSYEPAAAVAGILSLGVLANGLSSIAGTGLALARKSAPVTMAVLIAALVNVALNLMLIPDYGIAGAAWAAGVSWIVYSGYIFLRSQRLHPLPFDLRRAAVTGLLLCGIVFAAPHVEFDSLTQGLLIKSVAACALICLLFTVALPGWPGMLRQALRTPAQ
jgi:O-antigen/teichoic acid export membrane protein